jgi:cyclopropane fatty-acyl-phospholipid synthase-like methyltransferase
MKKASDFLIPKHPSVMSRYKAAKASMGWFVEDYMDGKVDIACSFRELMAVKDEIFEYTFDAHHWRFLITRFLPEIVIHSKAQDERIVRSHYDDANELFSWFLGDRMVYTSGFYKTGDEDLETAQDQKMDLISQKIGLRAGQTMLDFGCGWGTLVMRSAKHYGVDATGVTLAEDGAAWAMKQIRDNGVEDRARILRMDYRDVPRKRYDRITCLEMAEHVGIKNFQKFMAQIYSMLNDDGIFYLQIAGLRARQGLFGKFFMEDLVWGLFMNKYIFSGADASMPLSFVIKRLENVGFEIHSVENVGIHYSKTIDQWYDNWQSNKEKVLARYGERTFRMYEVFLGWSVKIAEQGSSTCFQIVCNKNLNTYNRHQWIGMANMGERDEFVVHR